MGRLAEEVAKLEHMEALLADTRRTAELLRSDLMSMTRERDHLRRALGNQPPRRITMRVHIVEPGDTLGAIVAKYDLNGGSSWQDFATLNRLDEPGHITPGMVLLVPGTRKDEV